MAATLIFSPEVKGATRWLSIGGFRLQPSEFAKPFCSCLCLAFRAMAGIGNIPRLGVGVCDCRQSGDITSASARCRHDSIIAGNMGLSDISGWPADGTCDCWCDMVPIAMISAYFLIDMYRYA